VPSEDAADERTVYAKDILKRILTFMGPGQYVCVCQSICMSEDTKPHIKNSRNDHELS
jgi:hypothetical protein